MLPAMLDYMFANVWALGFAGITTIYVIFYCFGIFSKIAFSAGSLRLLT